MVLDLQKVIKRQLQIIYRYVMKYKILPQMSVYNKTAEESVNFI